MRLADVHEVIEHPVEAIADLMPGPGIDVVVLDVGEPTVAMQALDQVRNADRLVPVLVVSGYQPTWATLSTVDLPEVMVVSLPITRAALLDGVDNLLRSRQEPVREEPAQDEVAWGDPVQHEPVQDEVSWDEPVHHEPDASPPPVASPFLAPRQRSSETPDRGMSFGTTTWPEAHETADGETLPEWDELIAPTAAAAAARDRQGAETPIARHSRETADPRPVDPAPHQDAEPPDDGWSPEWAWGGDVNGSAVHPQVASPAIEGHENDHWSLEPPAIGESPPHDQDIGQDETAGEQSRPVEIATPPPLPSRPPATAHASGPAVPPPLPTPATPSAAPPPAPPPSAQVGPQPPPLPAAASSSPLIEPAPSTSDGERNPPVVAEPEAAPDDLPDDAPDAQATPPRSVPPPLPPVARRPVPDEPSESTEPDVVDDGEGDRAEDAPFADAPILASTDTRSLILPFPTTGNRLGEPVGWADQGFDWWSKTDAPDRDDADDPEGQDDEQPVREEIGEEEGNETDSLEPSETDLGNAELDDADPSETDSDDIGTDETGPDETGSDETGSDETGSDETASEDAARAPEPESVTEPGPEAVREPESEAVFEPEPTDLGLEADALARRRELLGRTDSPQHPTELDRRLTGIPFRSALGPAGTSADLIALAGPGGDGHVPAPDLPPSGPAPLAAGPHMEPQPLPTAALIETVSARIGELYGVCDAAQMLADEIVEIADADAAAVLVPDGGLWAVSGGVGLRPPERQLVLDAGHWLVAEIAVGGRALLVEDTDVVRPKLAGAPLAAWRHLLAVPIPEVRSAVVLARGQESGPFGEQDLAALVDPVRRSVSMLHTALATRQLARQLAPLRDVDILQ